MTLEEWKSLGKQFNYKGYSIFYVDKGSGVPLLLLHGYPTASWDFVKIIPAFQQKFRIIAPDFLGFGFSDKPKDYPYSIPDQADIVENLLKHLEIKQVHIIAHDYAVSVAQELLTRQSELRQRPFAIQSIVFLNGGLFPETHKPRRIQKLLHGPFGFLVVKLVNRRRFKKSFSELFGPQSQPSEQELAEFWTLITYHQGETISHKLLHYMADRKLHRDRWVKAMQETSIPMRLINCNLDPVSGLHLAKRYEELIPGADVIHLSDIGHYPQVESPKVVVEGVVSFLSKLLHT